MTLYQILRNLVIKIFGFKQYLEKRHEQRFSEHYSGVLVNHTNKDKPQQ